MSNVINLSIVKLALLFVVIISVFSACKEPEAPEFRKMTQVKFESVHVDKGVHVNMLGNAVLFNPNDFGLDIVGMDFDVYVDNNKVTRATQTLSAKMPANDEFSLPLALDIPLREVFKGFKPTIAEMLKTRKIKVKIDGTITVKAGVKVKVPVVYEDEYPVPLKMFLNF